MDIYRSSTDHIAYNIDVAESSIIRIASIRSRNADCCTAVDDVITRCSSLIQADFAFRSANSYVADLRAVDGCGGQAAVDGNVALFGGLHIQSGACADGAGYAIRSSSTHGNIAVVGGDGYRGLARYVAFNRNVAISIFIIYRIGCGNGYRTIAADYRVGAAFGQAYRTLLSGNADIALAACGGKQFAGYVDIAAFGSFHRQVGTSFQGNRCASCPHRNVTIIGGNLSCGNGFYIAVDGDVAVISSAHISLCINGLHGDALGTVDNVVGNSSCSTCYIAVLVQGNLAFGGFDGNCTIICTGGLQVTIDGNVTSSCGGNFQGFYSLDCTRSCLSRTNGNIAVGGSNGHAVGVRNYIAFDRDVAIIVRFSCFCFIVGLDLGQTVVGRQVASQVYMTFLAVQGCGGSTNHVARYIDVACARLYQSSLAAVYYILVIACAVVQDDVACGGLHVNIASGDTFNRSIICRYQFAGYIDVTALGGFYRQARARSNGYRSCCGRARSRSCCRTYRNVTLVSRNLGRGGGFYVAVDGDVADAINSILTAVGSGNAYAVGTVDDFGCRITTISLIASRSQGYIAVGGADANRTCLCI